MLKRRTSQGGSVASFIVIGIILISGLIGTVYFVNKRAEQARKDQSIAVTEDEKTKKEPVKSSESSKPEVVKTNNSPAPISVPEESSEVDDLPVTGPKLSISELLGIYLLTTIVVAYVVSRRKLARSL